MIGGDDGRLVCKLGTEYEHVWTSAELSRPLGVSFLFCLLAGLHQLYDLDAYCPAHTPFYNFIIWGLIRTVFISCF